jgi:hypothetical protein
MERIKKNIEKEQEKLKFELNNFSTLCKTYNLHVPNKEELNNILKNEGSDIESYKVDKRFLESIKKINKSIKIIKRNKDSLTNRQNANDIIGVLEARKISQAPQRTSQAPPRTPLLRQIFNRMFPNKKQDQNAPKQNPPFFPNKSGRVHPTNTSPSAAITSQVSSNPSKNPNAEYIKEKSSIIKYFNLRFNYLHQFIRKIRVILNNYNFDTFNPLALQEIDKILNELEQPDNFILGDTLSELQIFEKIELHNKIIKRVLISILLILTKETKEEFLEWIKTEDYEDLRRLSYKSILEADNVYDKDIIGDLTEEEQEVSVEFYSTNKSFLLSVNPINEYKAAKDAYNTSHVIISPFRKGGGLNKLFEFYSLYKNVGRVPVVNRDVMGNIDYKSFERHNIDAIKNYMLQDITQFFSIINTVLKYIDIIALYVRLKIKNEEKDSIVITLMNIIIKESKTYLGKISEMNNSYTMYSITDNNLKPHISINLYHYSQYNEEDDEEQPYDNRGTAGGRKRTVGRPRKTPVKKPTAKASTKKPTPKPAKPAKKPTPKPTKPPTKKPAKPTAKKPTKPTTKKPTKNKNK